MLAGAASEDCLELSEVSESLEEGNSSPPKLNTTSFHSALRPTSLKNLSSSIKFNQTLVPQKEHDLPIRSESEFFVLAKTLDNKSIPTILAAAVDGAQAKTRQRTLTFSPISVGGSGGKINQTENMKSVNAAGSTLQERAIEIRSLLQHQSNLSEPKNQQSRYVFESSIESHDDAIEPYELPVQRANHSIHQRSASAANKTLNTPRQKPQHAADPRSTAVAVSAATK